MGSDLEALREWAASLADLDGVSALLHWDQQTQMPPAGAPIRAERVATLEMLTHERFISEHTGELITAAKAQLAGADLTGVDWRTVEEFERDYEKARRVPARLAVEMSRAASDGFDRWQSARAADDFSLYAPVLERNVELTRAYIACFDGYEDPYDVVLDNFAPAMRTSEVDILFGELKAGLVPLIGELAGRQVDDSCLHVSYPMAGQRRLLDHVLRLMGYEDSSWRLDESAHPFSTGIAQRDIRVTTRYQRDHFPTALYGAIHEAGHGLYDAGVAPEFERTPLGSLHSSVLHESQSRLWENIVGRSRPFIEAITPSVVTHSAGVLDGLQADELFRAVNVVKPQPIRLEADEVTYGLHIVVRFELERELLAGRLAVRDLPEAWSVRMRDYLGVEVRNDAEGVMQDVHWSELLFGYFPAYALGTLVSAQLWQAARSQLAELDTELARGRLAVLREWLRENVHQHGRRYSDAELLERVTGQRLAVGPLLSYLKDKLGDVYGLTLA
ncbi:MAG: carboxypeptidase M32 [Solirubrobacteraceae bacterium]